MVVGGGVAGLSAACALAEAGHRVQVVERRSYLGGRAASFMVEMNRAFVTDVRQREAFGAALQDGGGLLAVEIRLRLTGVADGGARAHGIDPDVGTHALRQGGGQPIQPGLAEAVGRVPRQAAEAGERTHRGAPRTQPSGSRSQGSGKPRRRRNRGRNGKVAA